MADEMKEIIIEINNLIYNQIRADYPNEINERDHVYVIRGYEGVVEDKWNKLPSMPEIYSPEGFELSGTLFIAIHVFHPVPEGEKLNVSYIKIFEFWIGKTPIKYDHENKKFVLEGDLDVTLIMLASR